MSVEFLFHNEERYGPGVPQARVVTPVSGADRDAIASAGATRLLFYLNPAIEGCEFLADGWADLGIESIDFVTDLRDQRPLLFLRDSIRQLSAHFGHPLNIEFTAFPALEVLGLTWMKGAESAFNCTWLKRLGLQGCPDEDLSRLLRLKRLEELAIVSRRLQRLNGISALKRLWHVDLYGCPKLENTEESLGELRELPRLTYLEIQACKQVTNIDVIATIPGLQKLNVVNNRGTLASLLPLRRHPALRDIYWESTKIEDGDMTPLLDIPTLERALYRYYRHYTQTCEAVCAILDARHGNPAGHRPVIGRPASLDA
jgi:hypothetical protein